MNNEEHLLKVPPGEKPGPQLSQERRLPPPSTSQTEAWGPPGAQSSGQQVSTPLESRHPSRHWCLNIDERRQRAMESASGTSGQGLVRQKGEGSGHPFSASPLPTLADHAPGPWSPGRHPAGCGPAGIQGRGQGRAHLQPAQVCRVHPGGPGPEHASLAQQDFGDLDLEVATVLSATRHLSWGVLGRQRAGSGPLEACFTSPEGAVTTLCSCLPPALPLDSGNLPRSQLGAPILSGFP
uniref:Testis expressed 22 n=1 Tax=Molossus molossus TaxID=27622 RepID=A0A7J8K1P2_MOLMO|nr:testis expressed 22 [Molossus molossus]